jgi:hypothetical protein
VSLAEQDAIARNTPEALIDRLGVAMRDLTAAVQHNTNSKVSLLGYLEVISESLIRIEQKLATSGEARSSVEIATSTRGYDIKTKAYQASPITEAGNAAVDEYCRVRAEIERRLTNGEAK